MPGSGMAALSFSVCVIFLRNEVRHRHLVVEADGFGLRGPSWRHILDAAYWHRIGGRPAASKVVFGIPGYRDITRQK